MDLQLPVQSRGSSGVDCGSGEKAWGAHVRQARGAAGKQMAYRCASPSGPPWGAWFFPCRGVMGAAALRRGNPSSGPHPLSVLPAPFSFSGILMGCLSFPSPLCLSLPLALFISAHHHPHPPQSLSSQSSFTACLTSCPALRQSLTPCLPSASAWPSRPAPGCLPRPQCPYPPCSDQSASQSGPLE